jgi:long-chain acyl-CoA synthetase
MPEIASLADIARVHRELRPDAPALIAGDRTVTYAEFDARTSQVAQAMRAAGVRRGDRVAFLDRNSIEFFEVMFGLAKLGAIGVPLNWRLAAPELAQILADAGVRVIVVGAEFADRIEAALDAPADRITTVAAVVAIGEHPRRPRYDDWLAAHPPTDPGERPAPDDVAVLAYTSGTTGTPKGVMLTHTNYLSKARRILGHWRFRDDTVSLAVMPLFHQAGFGWAMIGLYVGCPTVVLRDVDPVAVLDSIERHRVTGMLVVPAVIQMLLRTPELDSVDLSSLRTLVYGASPISEDVLVKAMQRFDCEFLGVYGMTESTGSITQLDGADHDPVGRPGLLRSCGRPYPWVEVRVVGPDGRDVPDGEVGELWTRSAQNMAGYWNNPAATAAAITPDGWLRTGDAGRRDADGYLYLYDRVKDMIVSGAENVYPAEVENVLMSHPAVADVAVIGVPDERWGEAVKAIVVAAPGTAPTEAELIAFARTRLAGYKLPKSIDFVTELPRNPSGKLLKRQLREPYWKNVDRRIH